MIDVSKISKDNPVIAWWSGGITSAVTCKLCIDWFGVENVRVVMIDTCNEDEDTYRFKQDFEIWVGAKVEIIKSKEYDSIQDVWLTNLSLNISKGAVCSDRLKAKVRRDFQNKNRFSYQAFGFEIEETNRAKAMSLNHPDSNPIFPLIYSLLSKNNCIKMAEKAGIIPPRTYQLGFNNNNCFKTGCVQGGVGYWQKMQREFPEKFEKMAALEHELTNLKKQPVTMLKDQSKNGGLVFLKPHPDYPNVKDISMMKGREPKPLMECNGFCGTNDLGKVNETMKEINYSKVS